MYTTIKNIDNLRFLRARAALLDLDLECSGFFAGRLGLLRAFAPEASVIFLSRHPETWIGSVVNYFGRLDGKVSWNYVARLVFDPICEHPVDRFYDLNTHEQQQIVERLIEYWVRVYSEAERDEQSMTVPLEQVDNRLSEIADFLGLPYAVPSGRVWKRENKQKKGFRLADYIEIGKYEEDVDQLGYVLT